MLAEFVLAARGDEPNFPSEVIRRAGNGFGEVLKAGVFVAKPLVGLGRFYVHLPVELSVDVVEHGV